MNVTRRVAEMKRRVIRSRAFANTGRKYLLCREYCGATTDVGVGVDRDEYVDYSDHPSTPDQLEIETSIEQAWPAGSTLLHIGVGNSSLAARLSTTWQRIDGITVSPAELERAEALGLGNYRVQLLNKYDHAQIKEQLEGGYEIIVDNNPTSFACCRRHQTSLMSAYAQLLRPGGRLLAHRRGLSWSAGDPRWKITPSDLARLGRPHGLIRERELKGSGIVTLTRPASDGSPTSDG